ncbi:hypothetical protein [Lentibacillus salicampi]|uniref:hypothetical protein n=1 Tax=Lentibacillus salicampi TaxID=175306 RepID=UPI0014316ED1|nr:hypothetical protein [Lentibacillus salicampi]
MMRSSNHNNQMALFFMIILLAAAADIQYKGLIYRLLSQRAQVKSSKLLKN